MSVSVYCGYYPKECNNDRVIPYLNVNYEGFDFNGNHLDPVFYDVCRMYSTKKVGDCYVFEDVDKLKKFAEKMCVPFEMSDYILWAYSSGGIKSLVFMLWVC